MQLKNLACNYFGVACNMCSCIRQVAKDNFSTSVWIKKCIPYMFVITHTKQDGYFEVRSQGIPHEMYKITYYIRMDFNLALQDEYLFEKSSEKNEYWNRSSTLLEILSFATCLMQLKNVACNSKIVACEIF